ncbi:MAG: hypothetical protein Q7T03_09200 [Deltaproteobacteria bacterium]|nr:hypothetical protein [Deltaproteobacteria bacterium]
MKEKQITTFLQRLLDRVKLSQELTPNEVHVFNVHAYYGHYQIIIGPADKLLNKNMSQRCVEINGAMHHLFITKNNIAPHPSQRQIHNNLKGCIIMRDLTLHMKDPTGSGRKVEGTSVQDILFAREKINLAGIEGDKFLKRMENTGKLAKETYKIIQEDILNALENKQYTAE